MPDPLPARRFDDRVEPRDEVLYRSRITLPDRRIVSATVVNVSPHGLMARVDVAIAVGEWIRIALPVIGPVGAVVRWSLGGRIGCRLEGEIDAGTYRRVLNAASGDLRAPAATATLSMPLALRA